MRRVAIVAALLVASSALAWSDEKQSEADRLFAEGRELAAKKDWKAACEKFEQANQLDPLAAGTKLNLGLCYEELGKYHTALKWYREAQARAAETNLPDHEKAAKEHTVALATKVPSVTIELAAPAEPMIAIDGESISASDFGHVEVDPGHHVLIAKAAGKKTARQEFDVAEKETKTLSIAMVDGSSAVVIDRGKPRRLAAYGLVVAGAALWTYTLYYGIEKQRLYNCLVSDGDKCNMDRMARWTTDDERGGQTARFADANKQRDHLNDIGTTMFVAGALAVGGAVTLYLTAPDKRTVEDDAVVAWAPVVSPDQVGFALSRKF